MKKIAVAGFAVVVLGGIALAQAIPGLFIASPTGAEQINVVNTGPQIASVLLKQMRDAVGYSVQSPSTGFTLSFGAGQSLMQIGGSSTLATGTINLTASPVDGQKNCFYTKPAVTSLTLSASSGQTLNDAVTSTSATTQYCYLYSLASTTWNRVQ